MFKQPCRLAIVLLASVVVALAARPVQLQTRPALGQIVRSSSAMLGGTAVPSGGTIVSGDIMSTAAAGSALVAFSAGNQVELAGNTIVTFSGTPDHVLATVDHGSISVRAATAGAVTVETLLCRIASSNPGSVSYSIAAPPGSTSTDVKSLSGTVAVIDMGTGQAHAVGVGEAWSCPSATAVATQAREAAAPAAGEQAGQASAPVVSSHGKSGGLIVLLIGGGVGAGVAAALAGGGKGGGGGGPASPSAP